MTPSKRRPHIRNQKITELETKLERAYQIIANLQQQNIALQNQVTQLQDGQRQKSTFISTVSPTSVLHEEKSHNQKKPTMPQQRPSHASKAKFIRKSRLTNLPHLQFYGLITLVVTVIVGLFGLGTLVSHKANNKNSNVSNSPVQPTTIAPLPTSVAPNIPINNQPVSPAYPNLPSAPSNLALVYNVTTLPNLQEGDQKLDTIVGDLVSLAKDNKLPTQSLSITLIDVNKKTISGYKQDTRRYPASVVKLFWMVALKAQIKQGLIPFNAAVNSDLNQMILKSDNDAASRIIDTITRTTSYKENLENEQFKEWKLQRQKLNTFFQKAEYKDINISHKTFPISYLQITQPQGTDLQLRGDNPNKPTRNKITTYQAARLMYEIFTSQAVGPEYSEQMIGLLIRDLRPEAWKLEPPNPDEFNPVENFFGESLSSNDEVYFASKAGWTSASRQEVAYIATKDGKTRYILAIFGEDSAYGASKKIFPEMSRLVFDRLTKS